MTFSVADLLKTGVDVEINVNTSILVQYGFYFLCVKMSTKNTKTYRRYRHVRLNRSFPYGLIL